TGERLHAIEEFGIALAVERLRLIGEAGGGLSFFPLAAVDSQHVVAPFILDPPDTHDRKQRFRLAADGFVGEIDLDLLLGRERERERRNGDCRDERDELYS